MGLNLIESYKEIDPELVDCKLRSSMELELNEICKGKADYGVVVVR